MIDRSGLPMLIVSRSLVRLLGRSGLLRRNMGAGLSFSRSGRTRPSRGSSSMLFRRCAEVGRCNRVEGSYAVSFKMDFRGLLSCRFVDGILSLVVGWRGADLVGGGGRGFAKMSLVIKGVYMIRLVSKSMLSLLLSPCPVL